MPSTSLDAVHVAAAYLYPVKACGAMPVDALHIDRWGGAEGDRRWAIVNAEGEVTWQGTYPRLVLISPTLLPDGLRLEAPGQPTLTVPDAGLAACSFRIWNEAAARLDRHEGHDAGHASSAWVSAVAGAPVRLVRLSDEAVGRGEANRLHVVSRASCDDAAAQLRRDGGPAAGVLRYRPNLVLDGPESLLPPFAEDHLRSLAWPGGRLDISSRCVRCVVPNVDPATGDTDARVLAALAALSAERLPGGPVSFGCYGQATAGARIVRGQVLSLELDF
ncbi:MOSC domain-containing protein [Piscinibacter gummiphilus]|uniref:MOSC N-terminal beta barrel domain-containing protein n=1 Tax=Piscinibacter gummiphilus TaxID=946333 RepID=A0ABZ0CRZ0_9BURK|nr:MOSC N-terminal beta barrel domain-containing protein [Piscinibacter gummiphilus]WOB07760.1 MOSC N-terminal beta barrel domain-containing protein [Piscinibacter gummiphilus]